MASIDFFIDSLPSSDVKVLLYSTAKVAKFARDVERTDATLSFLVIASLIFAATSAST